VVLRQSATFRYDVPAMKRRDLFSGHRPHWAHKFLPAPVLPMSRAEMDDLRWDACDVVLVTGDAYVDHPSFGVALIGRVLEAHGFRVGVIAQPDWRSAEPFRALGEPALFFGVTAGNMDSMVNRYTADRKHRSNDAYSPDDGPDLRPDRASLVYAQRCREAYSGVPVILGGIEASLRRAAHYDYWSDKVRRSLLLDAKADLILYGSAERAVVEVAHRLARGTPVGEFTDLRGTVFARPTGTPDDDAQRLPAYEEVRAEPLAFARAARTIHQHLHPDRGATLVQRHGDRDVVLRPPPVPLTTGELDRLYELPYTRRPHPAYAGRRLAAFEMIQNSITIVRGCSAGCTFCALAAHDGPVVQSRSRESVLREIERVRDTAPGFTGVISDLGGPTANLYGSACERPDGPGACRRLSCLHPRICKHLRAGHGALIKLYRQARQLQGVTQVLIGSGIRHDVALRSPEYVRELVRHHVGGYLKLAPEHVGAVTLDLMHKPDIDVFERFAERFAQESARVGKEQYIIPYFIAAHPGTDDGEMLAVALWLKRHGYRLDQVQTFLPAPMALATAMYHTGLDPRRSLQGGGRAVTVPRGLKLRRRHKAFLRYHDPASWPEIRTALRELGRTDLIGRGKRHLVPPR